MKIAIISDVHLEFGRGQLSVPDADIIILAGDIFALNFNDMLSYAGRRQVKRVMKFFTECSTHAKDVVLIAGNHEHYGGIIQLTHARTKELLKDLSNIHVLDNQHVVCQGIPIFGTTLWTDYKNYDPLVIRKIQYEMNDYKMINHKVEIVEQRLLTPQTVGALNSDARWAIEQFLSDFGRNSIIVTHHSPTWASVPREYATDDCSYAYANTRMDDIIFDSGPKIWVHGHIHTHLDYIHGDTRVICHPRGYFNVEPNAKRNGFKIIEWEN